MGQERIVPTHRLIQPGRESKVPTSVAQRKICRKILRTPALFALGLKRERRKTAIFLIWHAHCYMKVVHLVPRHERGGSAVLWSS